jgi:hypothetical protein
VENVRLEFAILVKFFIAGYIDIAIEKASSAINAL